MLDKERIKSAVVKGINLLPSEGKFYREELNQYEEPTGNLTLITTITGLFYKTTNDRLTQLALMDKGEQLNYDNTKFLALYDEESQKINIRDVLIVNGHKYKVLDPGENFGIYCDMAVRLIE